MLAVILFMTLFTLNADLQNSDATALQFFLQQNNFVVLCVYSVYLCIHSMCEVLFLLFQRFVGLFIIGVKAEFSAAITQKYYFRNHSNM